MGVQYIPTIIQLGRARMKFGLGYYQTLELDGLLRCWLGVQKQIDIHLQIQSYTM
jgi:hypothetical protein